MENHHGTADRQRTERLGNLRTEGFLDVGVLPWLEKLLDIASSVKYRSPDGKHVGRFEEMLPRLRALAEKLRRGERIEFDGTMEPSEALLYVFVRNLSGIAADFNRRWEEFPLRYVTEILGAADREPSPQSVWVAMGKSTRGPLRLGKGLSFTLSDGENSADLILGEETLLDDAEAVCGMAVLYEADGRVFPCSALGAVSSVKISEVTGEGAAGRMFPYGEVPAAEQPGLAVSSPTLLLCGGRRTVEITVYPEEDPFGEFLARAVRLLPEMPGPELRWRLVNGIFNVYVSTDGGWAEAGGVTVRRSAGTGALTVKFVLGEDFPPTGACRAAVHGMDSEFPAVKLSLDTGAWAYPYTWLKEFMVGRVDIAVEVEGLSTLQVYNALGRVDDSRPFAPFGIDTEKGAWFVVGSRELAVKRAPVCDLRIRWQDLPDHPDGMAGYYAGYRSGITNRSFVLDTAFLEDYRWKTPEQSARHYLFATSVGQAGPRVGHSPGLSLQDTGTRHRGSLTAAPPGAGPGDAGGPEIIQPGVGLSDTGVCQTVSRTAAPPGAGIVGRVTTNAGLSHTSKPNIGPPYATPPYDGPPEMRLPETRLPETDCREGDLRDPEPAKAAPRGNAQAKAGLTEHSPGEAGLSETGISQSAPRESGPLAPESVISGIRLWETAPAAAADGPFGYDISSRGGFIRLRLAGPEAGFGGKLYRRLYAEGMRLKSLKKFPEPNAPYNPVAERMTLGYRSSVTVDLRRDPVAGSSVLWHTTPQGWRQVYPAEPAGSVPLVYGMGEAANLLFKLRTGAGSVVRLYFDLTPLTDKPNRPVPVRWYWGDGYRWEPVADGAILADTTANLILSGILELKLPDRMDGDTIWLRAGIAGGYRNLPALKRIVTNVARLDAPRGGITPAMAAEGKVKPAKPVPGLRDIVSLTPSVSADDRSGRVYKMARTSEAVSHRGRAVTPRDYERLVLEEFPSVAEVKYIPPAAGRNRRDIALAVIPADPAPAGRGLGPKAGLDLIMRIEEFVRRVSSPYVENISVINPAYERVTVRCGIGFNGSVPYGSCRSRIKEICDRHIAPWYAEGGVPRFDHNIDSDALAAEIRAEGCVEWLRDLSLVTLSKEGRGRYYIAESRGRKEVVAPSRPYAVFVPAAEHTFHSGSPGDFGLEEMAVGGNFVIC